MTSKPVVSITRIAFQSDMTRADAPVIPFARILECVWPDAIRWLGLIGRTRLTPLELEVINLETWPEFREPHPLLAKIWDKGWSADWGGAGELLQREWSRTALGVSTESLSGLLPDTNHTDIADALREAHPILWTHMIAEAEHLRPIIKAPVLRFPAPAQPAKPLPTAARSETAVAEAA